jgi:hypothetical protein
MSKMHLRAIAAVLAALAPAQAQAATGPAVTAKGIVAAIGSHAITVNRHTCKITTLSPPRSTLRGFHVGDSAKITCRAGILRAIATLEPGLVITTSLSQTGSTDITAVPGTGAHMLVTGRTYDSITFAAGGTKLTCTIGVATPDLSGVQVASELKSVTCSNGVLTAFTPA